MSSETKQADQLLDELENLKQLLKDSQFSQQHDDACGSQDSHSHTELDIDELELDWNLPGNIPVLEDLVYDDNPAEQTQTASPTPGSLTPSAESGDVIHQIIDEVVAEYLPILERRLREKLLEQLDAHISAVQETTL